LKQKSFPVVKKIFSKFLAKIGPKTPKDRELKVRGLKGQEAGNTLENQRYPGKGLAFRARPW
jgi:hypothetical protein